ncbi:helix-turn-helix domain-containing protein [Actinophytocola xanthii]|uniref:Transcriptional regulator n=1 Tax=Actinophytocola xanthii TaxID=1912961 RepID=A0A1Q8CUF3_9PSEU|nr:helix-turn-helix transcriptional regulator [Actinophytocola xanthii]OLF17944.1 transcriptional regulator [Actinophytocola xanthii]
MATPGPELPVGRRIEWYRRQAGMSRTVVADRVGRSASWLKGVETGRLLVPRLDMLLRLAQALELADLAALTGNGEAVPVRVFAGERHAALGAVRAALMDYQLTPTGQTPRADHVARRLEQAWRVRHASPDHRTQLGALLPDLVRDAQHAARAAEDRRNARRVLSGVYQLADFYVAYQPAPELVWLVADRALTEGREADDPYAVAGGTWAMVGALRDAGRWEEAIRLATDATQQLRPHLADAPDDWRGMLGALEAEIALVHARRGRHGEAWAHLERAEAVARRLGLGYRHVQTSFSVPVIAAHATTLGVELRRAGEALRAAGSVDADAIASVPRQSRHLIEVARAHHQRDERDAVWALLDRAERTASETIRYNGFARAMLLELRDRPPTGLRDDVRDLCERVGIAA